MTKSEKDQYFPLSFGQERLWFTEQLHVGNLAYSVPDSVTICGPLNNEALKWSIQQIIRRHDPLQATFHEIDGKPVQRIGEMIEVDIPVVNLHGKTDDEIRHKIIQTMHENSQIPFDLVQGPLIRVELYQVNAKEHVLFLNIHHIVTDSWSEQIFFEELKYFYESYLSGAKTALPELETNYYDYISWQKKYLSDETAQAQIEFWKGKLEHYELLEMPYTCNRPPIQTFRGATKEFEVNSDVIRKLKETSIEHNTTLFIMLFAAFNTLILRYTGQEDILIGIPIAGRIKQEYERQIGFFVNTLPIRTNIANIVTFKELLECVEDSVLEAYENQEIPFEKIVKEIHPDRDLSITPLVQIAFSLEEMAGRNITIHDLLFMPRLLDHGAVTTDLALAVEEDNGRYLGKIRYNTDLFRPEIVNRMGGHYMRILEAIAENLYAKVNEIPILTESEKELLLFSWNNTEVPYSKDKLVHELVEEQVKKQPGAIAVKNGEREISYFELNQRANIIADRLIENGITPESRVGIYLDRSIEMVISVLAVLKAGGAYVPIDLGYPQERVEFILKDADIEIVLTRDKFIDRLKDKNTISLCLDINAPGANEKGDINPRIPVNLNHLAYIIYTSGSTGVPKGVMVQHDSLLNFLHWFVQSNQVTSKDRISQVSNFGFDASVMEIWPSITSGALLHIIDEETRLSAENIKNWLFNESITVSFLPSPLADQFFSFDWDLIGKLRCLYTGGDVLHSFPPKSLNCVVKNMYGPTENTIVTSCCEIQGVQSLRNSPSIGKPISNVRLYVLDRNKQMVPVGIRGELYICGDSLVRGYLNSSELSNPKFISLPEGFGRDSNQKAFRTGDIVQYLEDGNIEFIGRIDTQVKIRGLRIELQEIEIMLRQFPGVSNAIVDVFREKNREHLVGYVVMGNDNEFNVGRMKAFLQTKLPNYMIPSIILLLENISYTNSGKIDRKALPSPQGRWESDRIFVAPKNRLEKKLIEIWEEVLSVEGIGTDDNFFGLGGHSLLATQVVSRLNSFFGKELPLRIMFDFPTIQKLSNYLFELLTSG